jgi:UDP-N-acetylmuramoyl-tripeptide--D-alanyl-D-alanine ligase
VGLLRHDGTSGERGEPAAILLTPKGGIHKAWEGHCSSVPLPGRHNARNWLLALAVAAELGVRPEAVHGSAVTLPEGRNRRVSLHGIDILDETYNASPEAVLASLDLLAPLKGRRFAALGTMLELGERSLELHRRVAAHAARLGLDGLLIVASGAEGEAMAEAAASLPRVARVTTPEEALRHLVEWLRPGDHLLLKASRGVALEQLLPLLEKHLPSS